MKVEEEEYAIEEEQRQIQREIEEQKRLIAEQEAEAERIRIEEERLARLAEEEEEEEEDSMKISRFMFSGMSFKQYVENIKSTLNNEMSDIVATFVKQKAARHHGVHLSQRKVQIKHPIFRLLTINAFKWIIDRAYLFKLKAGQTAYREDRKAMNNVYFVLYGEFDYMKHGDE